MAGKAPSAGAKVTAGENAPYASEATGAVPSDSLAAESKAFQQANEATPQPMAHEELKSMPSKTAEQAQADADAPRHVEPAPTYVNRLYQTYPGGPKGKNITEDDSIGTEDKNKNTSFSQFDTKDDPAAAAVHKIVRGDITPANPTAGREKGIDGKTPYDVLGSERES